MKTRPAILRVCAVFFAIICAACGNGSTTPGEPADTPGLEYTLIEYGINAGTYRVSYRTPNGFNQGATTVVIPAMYDGKLVTEIGNLFNTVENSAFGATQQFRNSTITSVTCAPGSQLNTISDYAFSYCSVLSRVELPNTVTSIGNGAFNWCRKLTAITIPNSVTTIGYRAFYYCDGLTAITIPAGVAEIGDGAFLYCESLTGITVAADNPVFAGAGGILYNKDKTLLIDVPATLSGKLTIPEGVTEIGYFAFSACRSITEITIPASIADIRSNEFSSCSGLTFITVNPANAYFTAEDGILYNKEKTRLVSVPPRISGIVIIADGVTSIGEYAFGSRTEMTAVTIPASVQSIGFRAFNDCSSLISVTFMGTIPFDQFNNETIDKTFPGNLRNTFYHGQASQYGQPATYIRASGTSNEWYQK